MSIKNFVLVILLVLSVGRIAIAEDKKPEFMPIKAGEVSSVSGYVFTPEAIVRIYTKTEEEVKTVKAQYEYKLNLAQIDIQKLTDLTSSERRIQDQLLKDTILAKDEVIQNKIDTIQRLERNNSLNNLKVVGGFLAGSLITFTIVYLTADMLR